VSHQTWTHLLVNTVIHPDHYIRRWAHSSLDFRYCHDDLRVEICQVCVTCVCCVLCCVCVCARGRACACAVCVCVCLTHGSNGV
jgi:hypothetical protein